MRRSRTDQLFWERFIRAYPIKATAFLVIVALTVVSCGKEGAISRSLTQVDYDSLPAKHVRPMQPIERLHAAAGKLEALLGSEARRDLTPREVSAARSARARVDDALGAVHRQLDADRGKLEGLHAKAALARLDEVERKSAKIEQSLRAALAALPPGGARAAGPAAQAARALAALVPEQPQQPLSSDLSFGIRNAPPQSVALSAGIAPAYAGRAPADVAPSTLSRVAAPEDLAATPETEVTPAIRQLVQQLGGDPVRIYEYVRNEIRYQPYYGIRKGADQTLAEKAGSDADQAALLIALLRTSGIHARFIRGVAELPAAHAADWLGIDVQAGERLDATPDVLASGGIPTTQIRANGALAKVRFAHVWTEAYVAGDAYRGTEEGIGTKTWLPLDPSIKRTRFVAPRVDLQQLLQPAVTDWARGLVDSFQRVGDTGAIAPAQAQLSESFETLRARQQTLLQGAGIGDDDDISALIGSRRPRAVDTGYLPGSLPFKAVVVSDEVRTLPDDLNASVTFAITGSDPLAVPDYDPEDADDGGLSFIANTRDLANKRITIGYAPATQADAGIIDAYHGLLNAPTYAAALIPVLRVDGEVVARGTRAVSTGYTQKFRIVYRAPGYTADVVENPVAVGGLSAVSLNLGEKSLSQIRQRGTALSALADGTSTANVLTDARAGEMLSIMGDLYFARNDQHNKALARIAKVQQQRALSGAIVATALRTRLLAGFPVWTELGGATFDVDEDVQSVTSLSADDDAVQNYLRASGMNASVSEGQILQHAFRSPAASTTNILGVAAGQQIPIYQVDRSNIETVAAQLTLSDATKHDIRAAVATGATVIVPKSSVTIGGWNGVGYVVTRGLTADYRISGGASGGAWWPQIPLPPIPTDKGSLSVWVATLAGFPQQEAACVSVVLDIAALANLSTSFAATALWMPLLSVGFVPAAFALAALLIAVVVTAIAIVWAAAQEWNDANTCINSAGL